MSHTSSNLSCCIRYALPLCLISFAGVAHAMPGDDPTDGDGLLPSRPPLPAETVANGVAPAAISHDVVSQKSSGDLDWAPVGNDKLDAVRGGFDLGSGLIASLGIQQVAYINGNLVVSTNINIPNVANITSQQATALASVLNTVNVIQNGPGNTFNPSSSGQNSVAVTAQSSAAAAMQSNVDATTPNSPPSAAQNTTAATEQNIAAATGQSIAAAMGQDTAAATVIQNTLNNQAIHSLTTLNISVNTLDALRNMNLQSTLQAAQLLSPGH